MCVNFVEHHRDIIGFLLKMGLPWPLFVYFRSFHTYFTNKTVGVSGIRTWIVGIERWCADHLTTTTAQGI